MKCVHWDPRSARTSATRPQAELHPPADDRADRELRGVAGDPDADPPLVGAEVVDAVGNRVPELLVLEVMPADLDRSARRLKLAADRLEIADQQRSHRSQKLGPDGS